MEHVEVHRVGASGAAERVGSFPLAVGLKQTLANDNQGKGATGPLVQVKVEVVKVDGAIYQVERREGVPPRIILPASA